jgi:hypothetical protein
VAYTREPKNAKRPITFVFNGGPGAAAAYLHLGGIGPRAVEVDAKGEVQGPPPSLTDNPSTWLDMTDLVFVDPIGTGYSRASDTKDEEKFWGIEQDTDALWRLRSPLSHQIGADAVAGVPHGRELWRLPRSLARPRATKEWHELAERRRADLAVLEFSLLYGEDYDPLSWALGLPSLAAVNLEKKGVTTRDAPCLGPQGSRDLCAVGLPRRAFLRRRGRRQGRERDRVASHRAPARCRRAAPGPRLPFLLHQGIRPRQLAVLSRYDGSISSPDPNPASSWPSGPDPVLDATVPLWTASFVQYASSELDYKTDETYRLLNRDARNKWDFGTSPTRQGYAGVIDEVQEARSANPALEVLIAGGYTDLITPYLASSFLISQLPALPRAAPIQVKIYAGGHMLYLRPESREALKQDAKAMYQRVMKAAS